MKPTKLFLALVVTMLSTRLMAQNTNLDIVHIEGRAIDAVTRQGLPVYVDVMYADSSKFCTVTGKMENSGIFSFKILRDSAMIAKIHMMGYKTQYIDLDFRNDKTKYKQLGNIVMSELPITLGEVTVKATKVKMVYRGDTIVYNADAFRLADGSMLDALIEQLPGVELKGNQILVNGRYVESLLVNGKDFFRGDASVALSNLPAYMVDKVKVYEKALEDAHVIGDFHQKPLVVDVNLKKEFSAGWISNAEVAYGTGEHYLGRVFGLMFTNNMRIGVYGNINNTNDTRQPGSNGDWSPAWQATGITDIKTGGIDFTWDKDNNWGVQSALKVYHEDKQDETYTSATDFYQDGNTYKRSNNTSRDRQFHLISDSRLFLRGNYWFLRVTPNVEYFHNDITGINRSATYSQQPSENYRGASLDSIFRPVYDGVLSDMLVNKLYTQNLTDRDRLLLKGNLYYSYTPSNTSDYIRLTMNGNYNRTRSKQFSHYRLYYGEGSGRDNDLRNQYREMPSLNSNIQAQLEYNHAIKGDRSFILRPKYTYYYSFRDTDNALYRLDTYADWSPEDKALGMLPSTRDSLNHALDINNSNFSTAHTHRHTPAIELERWIEGDNGQQHLVFRLPLNIATERLDYQRGRMDTTLYRTDALLQGQAEYRIIENLTDTTPRREYRWIYNFTNTAPALTYNVPYVSDANPLYIIIRTGESLKNTHRHNAKFYFQQRKQQRQQLFETGVEGSLVCNSIANYRTYDKATGVTTSSPTNINGNWQASAYYKMSSALDEAATMTFSHGTTAGYVNSVDYISVVGSTAAPKSVVRNVNLRESLGFENKWEQSTVYLKANATYRYATGNREDFTTIHAIDYDYGLTLKSELPWGVNLSTDLTMYSRRGYADESMNTNDLVWNARLSKSILKGNLTFIADGFDLLGQLSNIRYSVNAQGIQETWHNVVPRYAMLHVVYRFNKQPKKK